MVEWSCDYGGTVNKIKSVKNFIISYESLSSIVYDSFFGILVLALNCYCGDNVKYELLSKHLLQGKQQHGG